MTTEPPKRRRWCQFSISLLLALGLLLAVFCSWVATELRNAEEKNQLLENLQWDLHTYGGDCPWYTERLCEILGKEPPIVLTFLVFNNDASINDETLAVIAQFDTLEQLWLNGDISVTDAGLESLKSLRKLRDLSLGDAPVSAESVETLRQEMPDCKIRWVQTE